MKTENLHQLMGIRNLTESTYILEVERKGLNFEPGQHILMGRSDSIHKREYSVYSGTDDANLELLIKEVSDGMVSKNLKKLRVGDHLEIEGPLGFFGLDKNALKQKKKFLFIASGTGIAPFHSMVNSIPDLDYTVLHGVRYANEAYESEAYDPERYVLCTTGDKKGNFHGRVTDYIQQHQFDKDTICYFCGNFNMIKEAMDLLTAKGFSSEQLHAEVYF